MDLVDKVMSLLFNMLSRLVITFLPRSKHLLISDEGRTQKNLNIYHLRQVFFVFFFPFLNGDQQNASRPKKLKKSRSRFFPLESQGTRPADTLTLAQLRLILDF